MSSLPVAGHDAATALHPEKAIVYVANSSGLSVVDASDASSPKLVKRLLFGNELSKVWGGSWPDWFVGNDVACAGGMMVVAVQDVAPDSADTSPVTESLPLVFDVSRPLAPRGERILGVLSGTSSVAMGLVDHHIFVAADEMIEYWNFEPDPKQQKFNASWLRRPSHPGDSQQVRVPGNVVEMKFVPLPRADSRKLEPLQDQAEPEHGIVYIATERALTYYDTRNKWLFWNLSRHSLRGYNLSDYFSRVYGMDSCGNDTVYLAAGEDGVYVLESPWAHRRRREHRFITRTQYRQLPGPALDVCTVDDRLYILCGEPGLQNVQYNERIQLSRSIAQKSPRHP